MKWTMAHLPKSRPLRVDADLKSDRVPVRLSVTKCSKRSGAAAAHCIQSTLLCFPTQITSLLTSIVSLLDILGSPGISLRLSSTGVVSVANFRSRDIYFHSNLMLYLRKCGAQSDYSLTESHEVHRGPFLCPTS